MFYTLRHQYCEKLCMLTFKWLTTGRKRLAQVNTNKIWHGSVHSYFCFYNTKGLTDIFRYRYKSCWGGFSLMEHIHFDKWVRISVGVHGSQMSAADHAHNQTTLLTVVRQWHQDATSLLWILSFVKLHTHIIPREQTPRTHINMQCNSVSFHWSKWTLTLST